MQQLERALRKIAEKFPQTQEEALLTDIHIRVTQDTGELKVFDDNDQEITRCVVEQWIDNKDDDFYQEVADDLCAAINKMKDTLEQMALLKPYSFVLENDDCETIRELYLVDDDLAIIDTELMAGLDKDLNDFLSDLLK